MASHLDLDIVTYTITTIGNNPAPIWTAPLWPSGTTYKAIIAAHESTFLSRSDFRHFELLGSYFIDSEAAQAFINTEVTAAGSGGSAGWTAAFVSQGLLPVLEVAGGGGIDVMWKVSLQTIQVRPNPAPK